MLSPQQQTAQQCSIAAGSLTFLGLFLPRLLQGIPPIETLILSVLGGVVMGLLGWQFGLVWASPSEEKHVRFVSTASSQKEKLQEDADSKDAAPEDASPTVDASEPKLTADASPPLTPINIEQAGVDHPSEVPTRSHEWQDVLKTPTSESEQPTNTKEA